MGPPSQNCAESSTRFLRALPASCDFWQPPCCSRPPTTQQPHERRERFWKDSVILCFWQLGGGSKRGAEGNKLRQDRGHLKATANPTLHPRSHLHIVAAGIKRLPLCFVIWDESQPKRNSLLSEKEKKKKKKKAVGENWLCNYSGANDSLQSHSTYTRSHASIPIMYLIKSNFKA